MRTNWIGTWLSCGLALAGSEVAWGSALTYHPLTPCRIVDTRVVNLPPVTPIPLVPGAIRSFDAIGLGFHHQGGVSASCGVPPASPSDGRVRAEAIVATVTIVGATGPGHLVVFPGHLTVPPTTSVLNFTTGQTLAVGTVIPLRTDQVGADFKVLAGVSGGHLVIDVMGYYSRATTTAFSSVVEGLPGSSGAAFTRFAPISGIHNAEPDLVQALMMVPRGCSVSRFRVQEFVIATPGLRTYLLRAYSVGGTPTTLLTCGTLNVGNCTNSGSAVIPIGSERLAIETFNFSAVPETNAFLSFEMNCE